MGSVGFEPTANRATDQKDIGPRLIDLIEYKFPVPMPLGLFARLKVDIGPEKAADNPIFLGLFSWNTWKIRGKIAFPAVITRQFVANIPLSSIFQVFPGRACEVIQAVGCVWSG